MKDNVVFQTTELATKIDNVKSELIRIYKTNDHNEAAQELIEQLNGVADEKKIRVVFIGQYTAGKSTVISALTGNKNIKIDSDIATCHTSDYSWGDVVLTDTPGLYTENPEHDERTINMIKKSDLLIYCITSDLFNQYTLADFEKWAFTVGYAGKMFLLVNKMSKESGEYEELKDNYSISLNRSLHPHTVEEFPCSFVDAKDYKDGIDDNNNALVEYSHFSNFISALNTFVKQKGYLGKLDTPIMIMKASIDNISQSVIDDERHKAYTTLVSRIEKKIDQKRNQFSIDARNIIKRGLKPITDMGNELSRKIGVTDIDFTEDDINSCITNACEVINSQLNVLCEQNVEELNAEVEDVLSSDAAAYFFNSISENYTEKKTFFEKRESKITRAQFNSVKEVFESITGKTISAATKGGVASGGFFIKATEASGSQIHTIVLNVGNKIGYKFKPWQAVNIAKNIGNVAKVLGPLASVAGLIFDIKETVDEDKHAKSVQAAQLEYRQMFIDIASDLELQYSNELSGMYDVYEQINTQLKDSRMAVQKLISNDNAMLAKLADLRNELVDIQSIIF